MNKTFEERVKWLEAEYEQLITKQNKPIPSKHGIYEKFENPVVTAEHVPLNWRYDYNKNDNPFFMERMGINAAFNAGAVMFNGKVCVVVRVEGWDRKSFFAIAESENGIDNFRFWDKPILIPQFEDADVNAYDMRITHHEDGYYYGLYCSEKKDPAAPPIDTSSAVASCGILRSKDLVNWERLPDLKSGCQQRNVVLHPEFVDGKYALYTRPQDEFIDAGSGGGIGWALCDDIANTEAKDEYIIDGRVYHTIKEVKNGQGPAPFKTDKGWLHIAHGVRNTAAGLRYVLYSFVTALDDPTKVIASPGGYLIAPEGDERVGDVSNVVFSNGAVLKDNGELLIYYASSDTRLHVARTTIDRMLDYCFNTPSDPLFSHKCVEQRLALIEKNKLIGK